MKGCRKWLLWLFPVAVIAGLLFAPAGNAQTFRGGINGTVVDPSGAVVPNAEVTVTNTQTGMERKSLTTTDGLYSFQDLPLGTYKIRVTAAGFPPYIADNVAVSAGRMYTLPVPLSLAKQAASIEVSAAAVAVDVSTANQSTSIQGTELQNIPLNGGDFLQLISLTPGYSGYSVGAVGSLNGTRDSQMNWQIDGTDNNDVWYNNRRREPGRGLGHRRHRDAD